MRRVRAALLVAFLFAPLYADTVAVSSAPASRPYRLGDMEAPRRVGFFSRVENAIPLAVLIFLGLRGDVRVSGSANAGGR